MSESAAEVYFRPRKWERGLYKIFLAKQASRFARKVAEVFENFTIFQIKGYFLADQSEASMRAHDMRTRLNESIHLFGLSYFLTGAGVGVARQDPVQTLFYGGMALTQLPLIAGARWQRSRIQDILEKRKERQENKKHKREKRRRRMNTRTRI
jgi:hypothetical protein